MKGTKFLCMKAIPEGKCENLTRHALSAMTVHCRKATDLGKRGLRAIKASDSDGISESDLWLLISDL